MTKNKVKRKECQRGEGSVSELASWAKRMVEKKQNGGTRETKKCEWVFVGKKRGGHSEGYRQKKHRSGAEVSFVVNISLKPDPPGTKKEENREPKARQPVQLD